MSNRTVVVNGGKGWSLGDTLSIYFDTPVEVGEPVEIFSKMGSFVAGKPFAKGVIVRSMGDDVNAPMTPSKHGILKNAWRYLFEIRFEEFV